MNESLDQQAGHRPAPSTGWRQLGHSCGNATSTTSPKLARIRPLSRAKRLAGTMSPCMAVTLTPRVGNLNGGGGTLRDSQHASHTSFLGAAHAKARRWFRRNPSSSTAFAIARTAYAPRSEEHTSELQS